MKEIRLAWKKIVLDKCPVLKSSIPDEKWLDDWAPMSGEWSYRDGCLIGVETGNKGGILFSRERYPGNVLMEFTASTVLPATRDVNAVFCADWDEKTDYLGVSYVCGLNGWWENKAGIEKNLPEGGGFMALTNAYRYRPGTEVRMIVGAVDGHTFMTVDDKLVMEYLDPQPIRGGHIGFSAYCTILKISDIKIREIYWEPFEQSYEPEF